MALTKEAMIDGIEVLRNGAVQVRTIVVIMEDGVQISGNIRHHIINPGDDYSEEGDRVKAICAAVHTDDLITTYKEAQNVPFALKV